LHAGLYVHIPYCASLCPYCDFNSYASRQPPWRRYVDALLAEFAARRPLLGDQPIESVYFGGGTPSLMPTAELKRLLTHLTAALPLVPQPEITLEANPGTVSAATLAEARAVGINRLSIGWQSTHDRLLTRLGRAHTAQQGLEAVALARKAGFNNISVDLIFAVPGQTDRELEEDLDALERLQIEHVSLYALTFHDGTLFARARSQGRLVAVDEDHEAAMMERIRMRLTAAGFEHYEVSNYARPNARARHNSLYWTGAAYLGLGAGAHSFMHRDWRIGWRWETVRKPTAYLKAWANPGRAGLPESGDGSVEACETLVPDTLMRERFLCGLRYADGLSIDEPVLKDRGAELAPAIARALSSGWATLTGRQLAPTPLGMRFADSLAALFF